MTTIFDVLRRPLVTEKSNYLMNSLHKYEFEVAGDATKSLVKKAVETIFDVKVQRVNVINTAPKRGRKGKSRRMVIHQGSYKKAIVTLAPGDRIPFFEGVE